MMADDEAFVGLPILEGVRDTEIKLGTGAYGSVIEVSVM